MIDLSSPFDITSWHLKGQELFDKINKEMKGYSEALISVPMPSKIQMTQAQYDDLHRYGNIENFYHTEDKMYMTPFNVMEVRVSNRTKATFKETMDMGTKEFKQWEKANPEVADND